MYLNLSNYTAKCICGDKMIKLRKKNGEWIMCFRNEMKPYDLEKLPLIICPVCGIQPAGVIIGSDNRDGYNLQQCRN